MTISVMEKMKQLGQEVEDKKAVQANIAYILENREDWLNSFPNRWIVVDGGNLQLTQIGFYEAARIMAQREALTSTVVFFYVNNFEPPLIVQLANVETT